MRQDLRLPDDGLHFSQSLHERLMRTAQSARDVPAVPADGNAVSGRTVVAASVGVGLAVLLGVFIFEPFASSRPDADSVARHLSLPTVMPSLASVDATVDATVDASLEATLEATFGDTVDGSLEGPARQVWAFLRERAADARALAVKPV
jgi:hypothetical protein